MTILNCQKRHHEEHFTTKDGRWILCNGLPRWPHDRPKPPRGIAKVHFERYMKGNRTICVREYRDGSVWSVDQWNGGRWVSQPFPKTEWSKAIQYAQKLAQERTQHGSQ